MALASPADILFYGGAAGGGKTDLLLGVASTEFYDSIIFRREYAQLRGIFRRAQEMYALLAVRSGKEWRFHDGRLVEFGAVQHPGDEQSFQGRAHALKAFDEITHFLEFQFRYLMGWMRTSRPGERTRAIATGNPPNNPEGEWVTQYWGAWLDPKHKNPAAPGDLRWYSTIGGVDQEMPNGDAFEHRGQLIKPKSRTFIPAALEDNPYYMATGYASTLASLPEPLRSQLLYGSFEAGREDNAFQTIPTEWVHAAQARWANTPKPDRPMTALGVDVARGGVDKTIISPVYGNWMDEQISYPGTSTPNGPVCAGYVIKAQGSHKPRINVDLIGVGASVFDFLVLQPGIGSQRVFGINSSAGSEATDKSKQLTFANYRAEMWWKMREMLDPSSGQDICLPPSRSLMIDLCTPLWSLTPRGILVESKDDIKKRIHRSPDEGDSCVYGFAIKRLKGQGLIDYYNNLED